MEKEYDFQKVCRACLNEEHDTTSVFSLIISPDDRTYIIDFLRRLTALKLVKGDGLPENICVDCVKKIQLAFDFSQQCAISDQKLRLQRNRTVFHSIQQEIIEEETLDFSEDTCEKPAETGDPISEPENSVDDNDENLILIYEDTSLSAKDPDNKAEGDELKSDKSSEESGGEGESPEKPYKCSECSKSFTKKCHLSIHSKSHAKRQDKKFTCMICGQQFTYLYLLKQHSYKHTEEKPFPCTKCSKGCLTAESLRRHMKIHDENYKKKTYACHVCTKEFPYPSFLTEHMKNHTGERPFLCNICGKGFRQNGALDYHMRSHTGYKPFKCEVCKNRFMSQSILNVHMRKHTNERPFVCDVCGMAFRQSTDMKSHKRTHTGDKPVLCTICGKRMSTTGQLTVHIRSHTGEKPFECKTCSKSFATSTMLIKHKRIHTGERPYVCTVCNKAFNQSSTLKTHSNIHNPNRKQVKKTKRKSEASVVEADAKQTFVLKVNSESDVVKFKSAHIVYFDSVTQLETHKEIDIGNDVILPTPIPLLQNL